MYADPGKTNSTQKVLHSLGKGSGLSVNYCWLKLVCCGMSLTMRHSHELDKFPRQRVAEAAGGRTLLSGDGGSDQSGVHPHSGGADGRAGPEEEESPAGEAH